MVNKEKARKVIKDQDLRCKACNKEIGFDDWWGKDGLCVDCWEEKK